MLMMTSTDDDPQAFDITVAPSQKFLYEIVGKEVFHSKWQPIESLKPLTFLRNVKIIYVDFNELNDFLEISGMKYVEEIISDNSKLKSLDGLENFEHLKKLTLCNTDVKSLTPIMTLKNLQHLDIRGTLIDPKEYEYFQSLHPGTYIVFITPMNPLRRNTDSLENPFLDYFKNIVDSEKTESILNEGILLSENKQYEMAISKFDKVLEINPKNVNAYIERSIAKQNLGDILGSIFDISQAIEYSSAKKYLLFYRRGALYLSLNKQYEALEDFNSSIKCNSNFEEGYIGVKEIYYNQGNISGMIEILNKLVLINPDNFSYYFDLGVAYGFQNNFSHVIMCMNKVLEKSPNDSEALYNRGAARMNLGMNSLGITDIKRSSDLGFVLAKEILNKMEI